jgi:hypothetical protein
MQCAECGSPVAFEDFSNYGGLSGGFCGLPPVCGKCWRTHEAREIALEGEEARNWLAEWGCCFVRDVWRRIKMERSGVQGFSLAGAFYVIRQRRHQIIPVFTDEVTIGFPGSSVRGIRVTISRRGYSRRGSYSLEVLLPAARVRVHYHPFGRVDDPRNFFHPHTEELHIDFSAAEQDKATVQRVSSAQ